MTEEVITIGGNQYEIIFETLNGWYIRDLKTNELVYKNDMQVKSARREKNEDLGR